MKSARERAEEAAGVVPGVRFGSTTWQRLVEHLERSFKEHARDQCERCTDAVFHGLEERGHSRLVRNDASAAVMNAPEPGKHDA